MQITINQAEIIAAVKAHVENNLIQLRPGATVDVELIAARGGPERFSAIVDIENTSVPSKAPTAAMAQPTVAQAQSTKAPVVKTTMEDLKRQQAEEAASETQAEPEVSVGEGLANGTINDDAEPEADESMQDEVAAEDADTQPVEAPAETADVKPVSKGTEDQLAAAARPSLFKGLKKPVNTPPAN